MAKTDGLINCQKCGERKPAAMKHAIFCKECSDALVEAANTPSDTNGDDLFARIDARRIREDSVLRHG